jgi:hypothetical protein
MSGNYSDTALARRQRRDRPEPVPAAPAPAPLSGAPSAGSRTARPPRRAESAAEKEAARRRRRIRTLEEKIASLEAEIEGIEARLWEEALTLGPVAARELATRRSAAKAELDALVDDWAKLSEETETGTEKSR